MTDLLGALPISRSDKLGAARRELAMRRKVYPRWVQLAKMKQDEADREIAIMAAIVAEYEAGRIA